MSYRLGWQPVYEKDNSNFKTCGGSFGGPCAKLFTSSPYSALSKSVNGFAQSFIARIKSYVQVVWLLVLTTELFDP